MSDTQINKLKNKWLGSEDEDTAAPQTNKRQPSYNAQMAALKFQSTRTTNGRPIKRF